MKVKGTRVTVTLWLDGQCNDADAAQELAAEILEKIVGAEEVEVQTDSGQGAKVSHGLTPFSVRAARLAQLGRAVN